MREQVCIVLNERESSKAKMAESLAAQLAGVNITASRIPVTENIEQVLKQRLPRVVVTDYLLGDYSTGLDVLACLQSVEEKRRPSVIFLTDEPSIQVAVAALRGGARHFIELDDPAAVQKTVKEIHESLERGVALPPRSGDRPVTIDDLILASPSAQRLLVTLRQTALKRAPLVCLVGPAGSGATSVAQALHSLYPQEAHVKRIDCRTFERSMLEAACLVPLQESLRLGQTLSLMLDHADDDDGELLHYLSKGHFEKLWPESLRSSNISSITACFTKPECAQAWSTLLPATVIQIPSLAERRADIPAFVQRFIREAEEFTGKRIKPFPAEIMTWLQEHEWPGEIRQLKSVVVDASINSMLTESDIKSSLEGQIELWLAQNNIPSTPLADPLEAAAVLEQCSFRYAVAAARLGISSKDLYALVHQPLSAPQEKRS